VSVTTPVFAAEDDDGARGVPVGGSVVDPLVEPLVERLYVQYGGDRQAIRRLVVDALAVFAGARVQTFVPILVEKRLRELYRGVPRPA
jgi:hypothetical protein